MYQRRYVTTKISTYSRLYSPCSAPGIMYGLHKIHKSDFLTKYQFPLILAAYRQVCYKISKFLIPIFSPLTTNQFTVSNSSEFFRIVLCSDKFNDFHMASFDIESLLTSIPLPETIQICVQKLFSGKQPVHGFTRDVFKEILEHAVLNSLFLFNGTYYKQVKGLGMGLPLGLTLANIFMCHHEETWIRDCPAGFAPAQYLRYIGYTFVIFRQKSHL